MNLMMAAVQAEMKKKMVENMCITGNPCPLIYLGGGGGGLTFLCFTNASLIRFAWIDIRHIMIIVTFCPLTNNSTISLV